MRCYTHQVNPQHLHTTFRLSSARNAHNARSLPRRAALFQDPPIRCRASRLLLCTDWADACAGDRPAHQKTRDLLFAHLLAETCCCLRLCGRPALEHPLLCIPAQFSAQPRVGNPFPCRPCCISRDSAELTVTRLPCVHGSSPVPCALPLHQLPTQAAVGVASRLTGACMTVACQRPEKQALCELLVSSLRSSR